MNYHGRTAVVGFLPRYAGDVKHNSPSASPDSVDPESIKYIMSIDGVSYADFLKTSLWKEIRQLVIKRWNYSCYDCGVAGGLLHVHHPNYRNARREYWGGEWVKLLPLCPACHRKRHGIVQEGE